MWKNIANINGEINQRNPQTNDHRHPTINGFIGGLALWDAIVDLFVKALIPVYVVIVPLARPCS